MVTEAVAGAEVLGLTIVPVMARTPSDLDDAFANMRKENCEALVVLADARITRKIVELANQWQLPAVYQFAEFVDMGGLLSYGADLTPQFRQAAVYVDKILKGASPADLPVEQPTKFELEVNLKTASAWADDPGQHPRARRQGDRVRRSSSNETARIPEKTHELNSTMLSGASYEKSPVTFTARFRHFCAVRSPSRGPEEIRSWGERY